MKWVIVVTTLLFLRGTFSFGLWHGFVTAASVTCPGNDPIAVVRTYYAGAVCHDAAGAQACLTLRYRRKAAIFIDPDWKNIEWIHIVGFHLFGRLLNDADSANPLGSHWSPSRMWCAGKESAVPPMALD
jgi:hypothetical protein